MDVVELGDTDEGPVVALWTSSNLTRPWNSPAIDYRRAVSGPTSAVLGVRETGKIVATVMVGHDGHRGWMYYLAVHRDRRRRGYGTRLVSAAEAWLRDHGAPKVQLMVRSENASVLNFYRGRGYENEDVRVLSRRLEDS